MINKKEQCTSDSNTRVAKENKTMALEIWKFSIFYPEKFKNSIITQNLGKV